ncbi:MAG: hypothetical protein CL919_09745 [Deltaproteobacteria bacterium]|nr:hypothetical protein [Deltaproteobacteria bacterium]
MDNRLPKPDPPTRAIPRLDTGRAGPVALIGADLARFQDIAASAEDYYGWTAFRIGDRLSRRWLEKSDNPYRAEIAEVAERLGRPGAYLLNLSYEWTCTAGVGPDPEGAGTRLLRTLDWPLPGLGRDVVAAGHEGPAGRWWNVTWPGFVGVATAMAPGRFAAAINQPPIRRLTPSCWLDWALNRPPVWRSRALPPVHLLRRVFDEARTYTDAKGMLCETTLAIPAFFTLAGVEDGEGCVIERGEQLAHVQGAPASIANHWIAGDGTGHPRGGDSEGRWRMMEELRDRAPGDFSWVRPPILNPTTRLAIVANAARGTLSVQGFEAHGGKASPATAVFRL